MRAAGIRLNGEEAEEERRAAPLRSQKDSRCLRTEQVELVPSRRFRSLNRVIPPEVTIQS